MKVERLEHVSKSNTFCKIVSGFSVFTERVLVTSVYSLGWSACSAPSFRQTYMHHHFMLITWTRKTSGSLKRFGEQKGSLRDV